MRNVYINLKTPETVQDFVNTISDLTGDFEIIDDRYVLDARSLMGIFSLDLQKPIMLRIYNDSKNNCDLLSRFFIGSDEKGRTDE